MTDFGTTGYGGPCPPLAMAPTGIVTVSALDAESFGTEPEAPPAMVGYTINSRACPGQHRLLLRAISIPS